MEIFETWSKVNFVDKNNVVLGYDLTQQCCENADYCLSKRLYTEELKDFVFDTAYIDDGDYPDIDYNEKYGNAVKFRLVNHNNGDEIFLYLYNAHNRYYSHGLEFTNNGRIIHSYSL